MSAPPPHPPEELRTRQFWRAMLAELIGTLLLVSAILAACVPGPGEPAVGPLYPAVAIGAVIIALAHCFGEISGAQVLLVFPLICWCLDPHKSKLFFFNLYFYHFFLVFVCPPRQVNPALTLSLLATRKLNVLRAFVYVFAQCLGASLGAGALYLALPRKSAADHFVSKVSFLVPALGSVERVLNMCSSGSLRCP